MPRYYGMTRQVRTLDAIQLAVALQTNLATPVDRFVCADRRLCEVAALEGLAVIDPERP
jgi:predicted nucleic acid-binding protein